MTEEITLTEQQAGIVFRPYRDGDTLYVSGPPGAGKSTSLSRRLLHLLSQPIRGESILILIPDRGRRQPVEDAIRGRTLGLMAGR